MTGAGGLITNGRTEAPQAQPPALSSGGGAAAPQPSQQQSQAQPQSPQSGQTGPSTTQGQAQPQAGGTNNLMNNALRLLHDPQAAPEFDKMIQQGERGAAKAAVQIGRQVLDAHNQNDGGVNEEEVEDTIEAIVNDITDIGIGSGALNAEPQIDGQPASKMAVMAYAAEEWSQHFPEFAQSLVGMAQEGNNEQSDASAQQLAAYLKQGEANAESQPPTG